MHVLESEQVESTLKRMWAEHRDYLKRMLISLTRDIDLTDDLLQETYLCARAGIFSYRGGEARAWLAAIAKNVFYAHARKRYVRSEVPLDARPEAADWPQLDSVSHLTLLELRRAIESLAPPIRTAVIMKHYGGFTYKEIAKRLGCPAGTAQRRVWTAMQKLRKAIGEEPAEMKCAELKGTRMLDYLCGVLAADEAAAIKAHLTGCDACREEAEEMRSVMIALDAAEGEYKAASIVELDEAGVPTIYISLTMPSTDEQAQGIMEFEGAKGLEHVIVHGEECPFEVVGPSESDSDRLKYKARLPRPVEPGERINVTWVLREAEGRGRAVSLGDGKWRFGPGKLLLTEKLVFIAAVRLPSGARLLSADPGADEVRTNAKTTLVWQRVLPPNEQFEFTAEYQL